MGEKSDAAIKRTVTTTTTTTTRITRRRKRKREVDFALLTTLWTLVIVPIIFSDTIFVQAAKNSKQILLRNGQQRNDDNDDGHYVAAASSRSLKNGGLFPPVFNVAAKADVRANATCGEDGPETFCKPSEPTRCAVCDPNSPDHGKRHNVEHALDSNPARWWQSPTIARGERYEYVTVTLDLKQVYQIAYVIIKAAYSPRPAAWILERSLDGVEFLPWQYYAPNDEECWTRYSVPPVPGKPTYIGDDQVVCTSAYSGLTPMENGEIHTHLINGRPGAFNHSNELEAFTRARYVRMRFQGIGIIGETTIVDKRRAFYSVREINIGGHCLCSGHASHCRYSVQHGRQQCECERHTCGERCDECCPMFNQTPWRPGTGVNGRGFRCEKCNCHGHADACRYDQDVADRRSSVDTRGKYRGGGVCLDCTEHTTGVNCEKCEIGYYRPNGVLPNASRPCLPCTCDPRGSNGLCAPDDSFNRIGKVAGACECKPGFSGYKCDQCAAGYHQFPDCAPCPCDSRGLLPSHDCEGECLCKANVDGELCERCKEGHFALTRDNEDGCLSCVCSGVAARCRSADLSFRTISTGVGWLVADANASRTVVPEVDSESDTLGIDSSILDYSRAYWLAPKFYSGNRLTSYGSNFSFAVTWVVMRGDSSGRPTTEPDLILVGSNGLRIAYGEERYSGQDATISVPLYERGWYHVKEEIHDLTTRFRRTEFRGEPVTRRQMLAVLADVEHFLLRARFHSEQIEGRFLEAVLTVGEPNDDDDDDDNDGDSSSTSGSSLVEECDCPTGYAGLSCELCAWGYVRREISSARNNTADTNGEDQTATRKLCVICDCNGHSESCDPTTGECATCEHDTTGPRCERCASGFYGYPNRGNSDDCKRCACPLTTEPNDFSPVCRPDEADAEGHVCSRCPEGHKGNHCESCEQGFFGEPRIPGRKCERCSCNGGSCDPNTGRCILCPGNLEGPRCERCKELHFGDPEAADCKPCDCDPAGSSSPECDEASGLCVCKPLYEGERCSRCVTGFGNATAGCVECRCAIGAAKTECDSVTGRCECLSGVVGDLCDRCDDLYYGLGALGCLGCHCDVVGSTSHTCNIVTGQCQCKSRVFGRTCDRCESGSWGFASGAGCAPCECDPVGAADSSCDEDTGRCRCRPGVGGPRCDSCSPGYYGFSEGGCRLCEPCNKPGHVCDQATGRCVCPTLTMGENCDRCRPGAYGLANGLGCKSCACAPGATKSQCGSDGQCFCRDGFEGLRCERCAVGYYGYPRCRPCACHKAGTNLCGGTVCPCEKSGQCSCKENVVGRRCDGCRSGTFGLSVDNPEGCTECFCFGRSKLCRDGGLSLGQRRLPAPRVFRLDDNVNEITVKNFGTYVAVSAIDNRLNVTDGYSVVPGTEGDVAVPSTLGFDHPLYWLLPKAFLGDKVVSYGGFIEFSSETEGGEYLPNNSDYPDVVIRGNDRIVLEHYDDADDVGAGKIRRRIRLHESMWRFNDETPNRETFMIALQKVQSVMIKASDRRDFLRTTLTEAAIDAAVTTPTRSPPFARDVEVCECPPEYNNTSCQDPSAGFYRWRSDETTRLIDLVGEARPCRCNGRSSLCDTETGHCTGCADDTRGERCHLCEESFHGDPDTAGCKPCPCPHADKRFSNTCEIRSDSDAVCRCKSGYAGSKCETCSPGFYGTPDVPGGSCAPCDCNNAGSLDDECLADRSGMCRCRHGFTGRDCSRCEETRHVLIDRVCASCDDNCTGILLDVTDSMSIYLEAETVHIADGYVPPPWEKLSRIFGNVKLLTEELKADGILSKRVGELPWREYRKLKKRAGDLLDIASDYLGRAITNKSRSDEIGNQLHSSRLEVANIAISLTETMEILLGYVNDGGKIEAENALKRADILLDGMKRVDFSTLRRRVEAVLGHATEYVEWLNSLNVDGSYEPDEVENRAYRYEARINEFERLVERSMEDLFTYDGIYEENEVNSNEAMAACDLAKAAYEYAVRTIDGGEILVEEAEGFFVDARNNFQDLTDLKEKLSNLTESLTAKEGILYRLNYEYEDRYVLPAKEHARNLSVNVDRYESLLAETRDRAVNPLKASEAYKNIVDALRAAEMIGREASTIADGIHAKTFPGGNSLLSLIDFTDDLIGRSSDCWNEAKEQERRAHSLGIGLEEQKRGVVGLKDTLNRTGIKDNEINVELRELKSDGVEAKNRAEYFARENDRLVESFGKTVNDIEEYEDLIANELKPKLYELKREGDSKISLASEKLTEARSNVRRADAKLISLTNASIKRKSEFDRWNETLSEKLRYLKDKISEARNTADGIRISVRSADGAKCVRSYRTASLQPGTATTIAMTIAVGGEQRQGSLFYLPSSVSDDFVALEMANGRIRFLWNVGGGTGLVTHPEVLETGDIKGDNSWYRIEAARTRNVGELSVRKQISSFGREYLAVRNETNPEYGRFDVNPNDRVWLGGIPESQIRPAELLAANGLPGCVHQVTLDGKPLGLWNFVSTAPDMACEACVEGVEDARDDVAYSFNGEGYAVRNRVPSAPYDRYTFGVSINFTTFDENALLFLAVNPNNSEHVMIFLREGRVVLHIGYGGNASMEMLSRRKYNDGNWTKIDAFRQYQTQKGVEQCSLSVGGNSDRKIGAPTPQPKKDDVPDLYQAKYYIGGVPPSFKTADKIPLPTPVSFLGCMSNIFVQEGYDPMAEQYFGVEPSCGHKHVKIVGFHGDGYYEHDARTLKKKSSSFSFSFRTLQREAMLLLSTFRRRADVENVDSEPSASYYSVVVYEGRIELRINAGKGEILLGTNGTTFNDGKYHSVTVTKRRKDVELRVDDAYQTAGRLPTGAAVRAPDFRGGLFLGGLPGAVNDTVHVSTNSPLIGAIKDLIFDEEVLRLDEPVSFERAAVGRQGPGMGNDRAATYTTSASLSRGMSTQPEGCQKVPYHSLEPGALKFGDKPHSHTQLYLNFKKFWDKKYAIEFDFRTYYPNGLLFITPGIRLKHYLMVVLRNGQLSLVVKNSKQRKEILFKSILNDGNWHRVVVKHDDRRLIVAVDNLTPQTIKVQKRISLAPMMYIGGLPESGTPIPDRVVVKLETLKGCVRGLRVNGVVHDMVGSTGRAYNVGQCFPSVESGAYFQDDAYAVYKNNFELGALLELQLEFRTSEFTGVLLSFTGPAGGSPSLSLELNNGKVVMSSDIGDDDPLYVEQHFPGQYTVCDNRWHRIQALYNDEQLALKVDELEQKHGLPVNGNYHSVRGNVASSPLYIGGLPETAPKGTLMTRDNFNGCIRNVMIDGERRDWTDMTELHNIHLSSCPVQQ